MAISYPFAIMDPEQPAAHGDQPHHHLLAAGHKRRSIEEGHAPHPRPPARVCTPPPLEETTRMLSSHYVEEIVNRCVRFSPPVSSALAAACSVRDISRSRVFTSTHGE